MLLYELLGEHWPDFGAKNRGGFGFKTNILEPYKERGGFKKGVTI